VVSREYVAFRVNGPPLLSARMDAASRWRWAGPRRCQRRLTDVNKLRHHYRCQTSSHSDSYSYRRNRRSYRRNKHHSPTTRHRAGAERKKQTSWKEFLTHHWELIVATDFFPVEAWTRRAAGSASWCCCFLNCRRVRQRLRGSRLFLTVSGCVSWVGNLTGGGDGILSGKRYLIHEPRSVVHGRFPQYAGRCRGGIC
jgi:hypothetical protein